MSPHTNAHSAGAAQEVQMTIDSSKACLLPARLPNDLPTAAAVYAAAGIPVFPCVPGEKRPLTTHGYQDATTDLRRVAAWWRWAPTANIGIPTGGLFDVLDVDVHAIGTGFPVLRSLQQEKLIAGWGRVVRSPSGGLHLYYPADRDRPLGSWSRGRAYVDFRGIGGYIIVPPSTVTTSHGDRSYEVIAHGKSPSPVDADVIREFLTPKSDPAAASTSSLPITRSAGSMERIRDWVAALPEGNRNAGLFWAACRLVEDGLTEHDTTTLLQPAALSAGLEAREVATTIRSAHRTTQLTVNPGGPVMAVSSKAQVLE
jgi:hypothetical protein